MKFCDEHMKPLPELTPEQERELDKLERLDKEEEERDLKLLAEKCLSCGEKCKWYFEKTGENRSKRV